MNEDIFAQAQVWLDAGEALAVATIVRIFGSSSHPLGTRMIIARDNRFVGAVSGGCVETDVYEAAQDVLDQGYPLMLNYKKVENPLIEIGLNCDGMIDVLVERLDRDLYTRLTGPQRRVNVTLCSPRQPLAPDPVHAQVAPGVDQGNGLPPGVVEEALGALERGRPATATYPDGRVALFEPVLPPPTLLIFGADQTAVPLVRLAKVMGFRTVVTDARPAYATREKHPDADLVLAAWPKEVVEQVGVDHWTFIVSLNHEPRFEDALLHALVGCEIGYLGAIGKPQRNGERIARAEESGFDLSQFPDIHTPIGLDLGGKTAEELALSILAEIVAVKNGRGGGMLTRG
jgi:xanthine dehydrogenase accessory factor